jgi:hypothetical protein
MKGVAGSPDGKTWVAIDIPGYGATNNIYDINSIACDNNGQFIAGGYLGVVIASSETE